MRGGVEPFVLVVEDRQGNPSVLAFVGVGATCFRSMGALDYVLVQSCEMSTRIENKVQVAELKGTIPSEQLVQVTDNTFVGIKGLVTGHS